MPGIEELNLDRRMYPKLLMIIHRGKMPDRFLSSHDIIQRSVGDLAMLLQVLGVLHLNVGGVLEHHAGEIASGMSAEDLLLVALFVQIGKIAAVIDMRVGQNDRLQR